MNKKQAAFPWRILAWLLLPALMMYMAYAKSESTVGTDVYLMVEGELTGQLDFIVRDNSGRPVSGAQIYITHDGVREFYGTTDADGAMSLFLFCDEGYTMELVRDGYETWRGTLNVTRTVRAVDVTLTKKTETTVDAGGLQMLVDGVSVTAGADGIYTDALPEMLHDITVITGGRWIPLKAVTGSLNDVYVNLEPDDLLVPGGVYQDRLMVFDMNYLPRNYELLQSEENRTLRVSATEDGEEDTPQLTQRSLMPSGWLMDRFMRLETEMLVFESGGAGMRLPLSSLEGDPVLAALAVLTEDRKAPIDPEGEWTEEEREALLRMFRDSLVEFRITPVTADALEAALEGAGTEADEGTVYLSDEALERERLRILLATGNLTEEEGGELCTLENTEIVQAWRMGVFLTWKDQTLDVTELLDDLYFYTLIPDPDEEADEIEAPLVAMITDRMAQPVTAVLEKPDAEEEMMIAETVWTGYDLKVDRDGNRFITAVTHKTKKLTPAVMATTEGTCSAIYGILNAHEKNDALISGSNASVPSL